MTAEDGDLEVSVVVCAYAERRWEQTRVAVESALSQHPEPVEVLLVIDHNADLAARAHRELAEVTVLESDGTPGLSGARNTGLRAATQPVTVFLDDDAVARPGWLWCLVEPYRSSDVVATGGSVHPRWPGLRPQWLPPEFDWVVGCSYRGLPESAGPVRNPIGANMSLGPAWARSRGIRRCSWTGGHPPGWLRGDRTGHPAHCEQAGIGCLLRARRRRRPSRRGRAPQIRLLPASLLA